jgi:PAS domain S-box-containing protein
MNDGGRSVVREIRLLIADDSADDATLVAHQLRKAGLSLTYTRIDSNDGLARATSGPAPDVVICDYNMPTLLAEDVLEVVQALDPDVPFILVSGEIGDETAAALMRAGAHDFVRKSRLARLVPAVQRELREAADRRHRRQAAEALRDSEERFRLLAEHAQDIIFRCRLLPRPDIEYLSPALAALVGHQPAELYGDPTTLFSLVDTRDRAAFEESWKSPPAGTLRTRWHRRDGQTIWMEQRAVAITDDSGEVAAVEGILRDITEQIANEQERMALERQLRQAERIDSLGQLAGGIAHDFNNLLAVISGYASAVIEDLPSDHPSRPDIDGINDAAARGAALTRQLLIFSRLEPSQPETLDLNIVVTDMYRLLNRTLGEDVDLVMALEPGLPSIRMDRSKLEQVLMNAAINARAAMPDGGRLTIATTTADATSGDPLVRLAVVDTGCGMSPEVASRAFEPFFTTKGRGRGTGLGLSTAYGAVTDAGGTIALESEPGHGTTLDIHLPATVAEATTPVIDPATPPPQSSDGETVLVVEDEEAVRDIVSRILAKAGYRVEQAASPRQAIELYRDGPHVDALLSDVIMPGMSGTQLAAELRRERPDLPVLLMSGYTSGTAPGGQELPPDAPLIRKPFAAATLLHELHRILALSRAQVSPNGRAQPRSDSAG